jgi:ABC-type nitrate/sulfonate/bicarbonate transport system ATPase subunit
MREILRAENIKKSYEDKDVLADISITLNEGELVSILGVSGVGKTTLFNVLSGIIEPDEGSVVLEDEDITGKRGKLSYMLQKDLLLPHKTVVDNVALPLTLSGVPKKEAREKAASLFDQFGLEGTEKKYPSQLSGGMRQRAALLRTYLCDKKVALLDEPFSALDAITRSSVQDWYLSVMSEIKLSTLFITHDIDEAILLSDRIYIMKGSPAVIDGELVISTPKPRNHDFMMTDEFLEFKKSIREML